MRYRFLWLLLPIAAWTGYQSASPAAAPVPSEKEVAPAQDGKILAAAAKLEKATPTELANKLDQILALSDPDEREMQLRLLFARWAEVDPAGGLAELGAKNADPALRCRLLAEWALLDSDAAWKAIAAGPEGDDERVNVTAMLLTEDREIFMKWFRQVRRPMPDDNPAWLLVAERHGKELEEIAMALATGPEARDCPKLFALLAKAKADKDPAAAFEWAFNLDPAIRKLAITAALEAWSKTDPMTVWKLITSSDPLFKDRSILNSSGSLGGKILKRLAQQDPEAAMKLICEARGSSAVFDHGGIDAMREALGPALASGKMKGVDAFRLINSAKGAASNLGLNVFRNLWREMPADLLEQTARDVLAEPHELQHSTALGGIANSWMQKDPAAALAFVSSISDPGLKAQVYAACFMGANVSSVGHRQQIDLLEKIPATDRAAAYSAYMGRQGDPVPGKKPWGSPNEEAPPERIAPLLSDLPPSEDLNRAARITAMKWGQNAPSAALDWAQGLEDPAARRAAYSGAFDGWAYQDPYAAGTWLAARPASPERDAAALSLVDHLALSDADAAWQWAAAVGDPAMRLKARAATLREWAERDPAEAQTAYRQIAAGLSRSDAAQLSDALSGK